MKRPGSDNFESWNEEFAKKYDPDNYYYKTNPFIRFVEQKRMRLLVGMLSAGAADKVIEIGCGGGHVIEKMREGDITGVDISDFMLEKARARLEGRPVKLIKADAGGLPFGSASYDKVVCTEVLEHVMDPELVLGEIYRIARDDAAIILTVPNEKLINTIKRMIIRLRLSRLFFSGSYQVPEEMNTEWHLHIFDLKILRKMLAGRFRIEEIRAVPFVLLPLRYVLKCKKETGAAGRS